MYGPSALKALLTLAGLLLPALLIFLAVTLLVRVLRGREEAQAAALSRRLQELEAEVAALKRRIADLEARDPR